MDMGLTGKALADKQILVSAKGSYDPKYRFEADKVGDVPNVDNIMIVPLINEKQQIVGALQLYNRVCLDVTQEIDLELIQILGKVIAAGIESATELDNAWTIVSELNMAMDNIRKLT